MWYASNRMSLLLLTATSGSALQWQHKNRRQAPIRTLISYIDNSFSSYYRMVFTASSMPFS